MYITIIYTDINAKSGTPSDCSCVMSMSGLEFEGVPDFYEVTDALLVVTFVKGPHRKHAYKRR